MEAISMPSTKKGNKWWTNVIYEPIYRVSESEISDLNAGQETNLSSLPSSSREAQLPSNSPTDRLLSSDSMRPKWRHIPSSLGAENVGMSVI